MENRINESEEMKQIKSNKNQKGTATIIAVMIMSLMTGFVALSVARTTSESGGLSNDISESKAYAVAQASLENMTLEADSVFDSKLDLEPADETAIETRYPSGFPSNYSFAQEIRRVRDSEVVDATGAEFQGLKALRDEWELSTSVTDTISGVQSNLRRRFFNNRVPLFQFGVFYDDDLDFSSAPRFDFGGRVHSNANLYASSWSGLYFNSRITVNGQVVTDMLPNGRAPLVIADETYVKDANGVFQLLRMGEGSALGFTTNGANLFAASSWRPPAYRNNTWLTAKPRFGNNLLNEQNKLNLPLKAGYIGMIKRTNNIGDLTNDGTGTASSPSITPVTSTNESTPTEKKESYYNKVGIRISFADNQAKLPGCAGAVGVCGVRLDGNSAGTGNTANSGDSRGYQPLALSDGTVSTRINGERLFIPGRENWIKIETVASGTFGTPVTKDITADILSLGVTERAEEITTSGGQGFRMSNAYTTNQDKYSIVKIQRFRIDGEEIKANSEYLTAMNWNGTVSNFVVSADPSTTAGNIITPDKNPQSYFNTRFGCHDTQLATPPATSPCGLDHVDHRKAATINGISNRMVVPFPIMTFDTREGIPFETTSTSSPLYWSNMYPNGKLPWNGVMSSIDIDLANLRRFLKGDFDNLLPTTTPFAVAKGAGQRLKSTDIPNAKGWVVYFSDRRGDFDFDGEYDMEDIFANASGTFNTGGSGVGSIPSPGEDVNANGTIQADYVNEAPLYSELVGPDVAASVNTRFYRRAVRLINGSVVPGNYDSSTPENTKGFTFASENGVYIRGNFNATGVTSYGTPTPPTDYTPQNTSNHIPTSIAADGTTILSNAWEDATVFRYPFDYSQRAATETTARFADLTGDGLSFAPCANNTTNSGSSYPCITGGVHNLNRFLENWSGKRLNYTGSLINLFNSRNNNGAFKCCVTVYSPPNRNFSFDTTFLDPNRLPPGTPFVQSIQVTGFQKVNE